MEEKGLAMTYGGGQGQNVTHYYAGAMKSTKKKKKKSKK